jgi:hypothetical protein
MASSFGRESHRSTNSSRNVLIVSPYFPPSSLAGVHRARHLVKHLPSFGWRPRLLCVDERFHEQAPDPFLSRLVPEDADIEKVTAIPTKITRRLGIGDISLRAFAQLRAAVLRSVSGREVIAVVITGSPFYPMLLAPTIRRLGLPVVLDFQDPWISRWGETRPPLSKQGAAHWLARRLEPIAVKSATFITSVSEAQNAEMQARYPALEATEYAAIPIGGDPEDFEILRTWQMVSTENLLSTTKFNISFVGTYMPRSGPLMRAFLRGVRFLWDTKPQLASRIRINFIGTGNHSAATATPVTTIAREFGVVDSIHEVPERLPYSTALAVLANSDAVLLVGSDEPHYTASKIYPALMSGRPFISIFHAASSSHDIVGTAGGGFALGYVPECEDIKLSHEVAVSLGALVSDPSSLGYADRKAYAGYEASAIAGRFSAILDRIAG